MRKGNEELGDREGRGTTYHGKKDRGEKEGIIVKRSREKETQKRLIMINI